ncbi:hypothetical protein DGMP_14460 [Desulfomarina profundi]|uniref:Uncharacterized protein n=1 Tax=Desulfomarina profundi TaxID=2772557 RepID=A0A8D5JD89_9BACT|nr:hypothetical protein DGMP_14460 [Desulfomarina profundi]
MKTSVLNYCRQYSEDNIPLHDICASFQEAVVDVLVEKTILAAGKHGIDTVVLGVVFLVTADYGRFSGRGAGMKVLLFLFQNRYTVLIMPR